jgi:glycosyltransferase involved in cell wall biosynthesis
VTATFDLSVVTSGHDVADARLHRIVAALVRAGCVVEVLGLGDPTAGPVGATVHTSDGRGLVRRATRALTLPWRASGAVLVLMDPDVAIASLPIRPLRRRRLVADVHEDYAALLHDRPWATGLRGWLGRQIAALGPWAAAKADLTVVADEHIPPPAAACRRRLVVRNLPNLAPMAGALEGEVGRGSPRAVYVGDVRRSRGLATMVEAIALAPGWTLDIVGPVSTADAGWLSTRLGAPDVAGRIRLHGRRPPADAWRILAGAAVGLVLLEDTPAFRAAMPSKVYEYLAAGMAVLATPLPRVAQLLTESGAGALATDAEAAAAILRRWAGEGADELAELRMAARRWRAASAPAGSPYDELAAEMLALVATVRGAR